MTDNLLCNRAHRVIIASGSRYMLEIFMKYSVEELPRVKIPEPFSHKNKLHPEDQVGRILKYIYGNQVSSSVVGFLSAITLLSCV